jgi:hypothetical protein
MHKKDVAVEAMGRAALLPLLQVIPRCSSPPPRRRVQITGEPHHPLLCDVDLAFELRLDRAL